MALELAQILSSQKFSSQDVPFIESLVVDALFSQHVQGAIPMIAQFFTPSREEQRAIRNSIVKSQPLVNIEDPQAYLSIMKNARMVIRMSSLRLQALDLESQLVFDW